MSRVLGFALLLSACAGQAGQAGPRVPVQPTTPFVLVMPAPASAHGAPITLTAEDGTGLQLAALDARIEVTGPLAETELRLRFVNPTSQLIEGRFRLALPARSFVSRIAMNIGGQLREADARPLATARDVYEATLQVKRDPLLVEQKNENEITARVYPIEPRETKEVVVAWTSEIGVDAPVTLPLRGLPAAANLSVAVSEDGQVVVDRHQNDLPVTEDFRWTPRAGSASAIRSGNALVARVRVPTAGGVEPIGKSLTVLLDTSASQAADLESMLDALDETLIDLAGREPSTHLVVAAFDQEVVRIHEGPIGPLSAAERRAIRTRGALGASDLEHALGWAAASKSERVLLVGDGLPTAGSADRDRLVAATRALGATRLDAMTLSNVTNAPLLHALTSGVLEHDGVVVSRGGAAARLRAKVLRSVPIAIPGATAIYPSVLHAVQEGDERVVYAELPSRTEPHVSVGGEVATLTLAVSKSAVRAVARAHLDALTEKAETSGWNETTRAEVVALAEKHKLASPLTALLVVEPPSPARTTRAPILRQSMCTVTGRLPPETVQFTVRQNAGRFRACYSQGLLRNPKLRGRVTTKLTMNPDGDVVDAIDGGSDLPDQRVISCIVETFKSLTFPKPPGSYWVTVIYPFMLHPLGEEEETDPPPAPRAGDFVAPWRFRPPPPPPPPPPTAVNPWNGVYARAREAIGRGALATALAVSTDAVARRTDDVVALLALGESLGAAGLISDAARAYGSIADLYPNRADMLRTAGTRLSGIGAHTLAIELLRRAKDERPDQPSSHHLLAMALFAAGSHAEAIAVLGKAIALDFPARYVDANRVLAATRGFMERAWRGTGEVSPLMSGGGALYVITWETDASDVSLDLPDAKLLSLGHTSGFGPNATLAWDIPEKSAASIQLARRGPSGDALGVVHVLAMDKSGHASIRAHPFVLMTSDASLRLSTPENR